MRYESETIAAISTAISNSGIGIVRMSGSKSFEIADKVYINRNKKKLTEQKTHTIHYGYISEDEETIDEVLVMLMRAPHTYTGEDIVEINCHGGVYVVKKVLELLIKNGARPADPGEFTKRSFLNGKMDLSQAEAVGDLINAQNEYALKSSINHLKGNIRKKITNIRNKIIYQTAFIETALDDPEHISVDGYGLTLKNIVNELLVEIDELLKTCDNGRIIKEGIKTVIVGKPNVGKSSLLNTLVGEERAIVTDIAGTTRDVLEEHINLNGIMLNIIDTAGIRETEDVIEQIGVEKAIYNISDSDLIICVIDASVTLDENDYNILEMIKNKPTIILLNKSDLNIVVSEQNIKNAIYARFASKINKKIMDKVPILSVSTKKKEGINNFENQLKNMFYDGNIAFNDEIYITNVRHKAALKNAYESLKNVNQSIEHNMPEDFYSIDLIDAYESLGSITGETMGEDLVNEIFSKFCMGK